MKSFLLYCILFLYSCGNGSEYSSINKTAVAFKSDSLSFQPLNLGDSTLLEFEFRNIGNAPLRILTVGTSCGCTTVSFDSSEVLPGKTGEIVINYKSQAADIGYTVKPIVVEMNTKEMLHTLFIHGTVNSRNGM